MLSAGALGGVPVFLDLNGNLVHDENEPQADSAADGRFSMVVNADAIRSGTATPLWVARVPAVAHDAADGGADLRAADRLPGLLLAPFLQDTAVRGSAVLSPLTTLVAGVQRFEGLPLAAAQARAAQLWGSTEDPMADYALAGGEAVGTAPSAASQGARRAADAWGVALQAIRTAHDAEGGLSVAAEVAQAFTLWTSQAPVWSAGGSMDPEAMQAKGVVFGPGPGPGPGTPPAGKPADRNFVVMFKDSVGNPLAQARELMNGRGGQIRHVYSHVAKGFSATVPGAAADAFAEGIARHPLVDTLDNDVPMATQQTVQANATWGLDRSDQRLLPLSGSYSYIGLGTGVNAYVVDTGILSGHTAFRGRVKTGFTAVADGRGTQDCNGHGTHVAGTIGSSTWGMAKGVSLVPVRVLDCAGSGLMSSVVAGLDWIAANAVRPAVVNMSLGGSASATLDTAVANLIGRGISVVVAAGNSNVDACTASPARTPAAITVAAIASADARANYSNWGTCVDLFAPGTSITSTWIASTTATNTISGTSMAAPHVAGMAALWLQRNPAGTPAQLSDALKAAATRDRVTGAGTGTPNLLLFADTSSTATVPSTSRTVYVSTLMVTRGLMSNGWKAGASFVVRDQTGALVPGAVVTGTFSAGGLAGDVHYGHQRAVRRADHDAVAVDRANQLHHAQHHRGRDDVRRSAQCVEHDHDPPPLTDGNPGRR